MTSIFSAALFSASLLAGTVGATPQDAPRDPMARADADGDGVVTREEALTEADARFAAMDVNKDGKISKDEQPAPRADRPGSGFAARMLERLDSDHDGAISGAEMQAQAAARFTRIDTNGDGKIDQAERSAARDAMMRR